jgi:NAD(P)-dependent dehydrogenase (short-subunit alcohol dehydrogenase family)
MLHKPEDGTQSHMWCTVPRVAPAAPGKVGVLMSELGAPAFLAGPESSFITGNELLVDGGAVAAQRWSVPTRA